MRRFVDEPALIASMGRESRRIAEERFDVHEVNRLLLDELGLDAGNGFSPASADAGD